MLKNIKKIIDNFKYLIEKLPLTLLSIFILTFIIIIEIIFFRNSNLIAEYPKVFEKIYKTLILLIPALLLTEVNKTNNKKYTSLMYILSILLAIALGDYLDIKNLGTPLYDLTFTYFIILIFSAINSMYKKSKENFQSYIINISSSLFYYTILIIVLNLGILFITFIFSTLLLDEYSIKTLLVLLTISFGIIYTPLTIVAMLGKKDNVDKFIEILIKYIILPISIIASLIIYLYIFKLIINQTLPKNLLFPISITVFILGYYIYILLHEYKESHFISKIIKLYKYIFIPFIFIEILSLSIRISEYGLTQSRYLGIILIIAQIIFIILVILNKHIDKIIFIIALILIITFSSPISGKKISKINQANRLKTILVKDFAKLTKKEKQKVISSYYYLSGSKELKRLNISKTQIEKIKKYNQQQRGYWYEPYNEIKYISENNILKLNISDYNNIERYLEKYSQNENKIKINYNNEIYILNINSYTKELIKYKENTKNKKPSPIIKINNKIDFYIEDISFSYNIDTGQIKQSSLYITGYILEK